MSNAVAARDSAAMHVPAQSGELTAARPRSHRRAASLDGQSRLVIKGRFQPKGMENILRRYMTEYVACSMCGSAATQLTKETATRLFMLTCTSCGAKRSVKAIKQGFTAVMRGERRKARLG